MKQFQAGIVIRGEWIDDHLIEFGGRSTGITPSAAIATPQDALESTRELCKWIVCEDCDPAVTPPPWEDGEMFKTKVA